MARYTMTLRMEPDLKAALDKARGLASMQAFVEDVLKRDAANRGLLRGGNAQAPTLDAEAQKGRA